MTEKEENSCKDLNTLEILIAVLESGNSIELPATGYSMFPALRPGDMIIVKSIFKNNIPPPGSVVVYIKDHQLIVHRIVKVTKDQRGNSLIITRGDSRPENDEPVEAYQLLGVAFKFRRKEKEYLVKSITLSNFGYKLNRLSLALYFRVRQAYKYLHVGRGRNRVF